jgi:hypothetical protein
VIRRSARAFVLAVGGLLVAVSLTAAIGSRSSVLRQRLIDTLSQQLDSSVELESLSVSIFPLVRIEGSGLNIREREAGSGPPLIAIERFRVEGGLLGLLRRPRTFRSVHLDGLEVTIQPRPDRDDSSEERPAPISGVIIQRVLSHDARLTIVPRREGKQPRVFEIHDLELRDVGFDRAMPFEALLTNPLPHGQIAVEGSFGPWRPGSPGLTPLAGRYLFRHANLSTIDGISGTLSSDGEFSGTLNRIAVRGTTSTPDFGVDVGGKPVPLETRFAAVVDGTGGDTYLNEVAASFLRTRLVASGAIAGAPGVKGRTVTLDVRMDDGRIEDVLRLGIDATEPLMTGRMRMRTRLLLPPATRPKQPVIDRLQLEGTFELSRGEFNDGAVQRRLVALSRRSRGLKEDTAAGEVVSDLSGRYRLARGTLSFTQLTFGVPGAQIRLAGRYGLRTQALDFLGHLRMKASISQAIGDGWKGVLARPFDPLFRRDGAGAVVPITIKGTREAPDFGVDVKRALSRR